MWFPLAKGVFAQLNRIYTQTLGELLNRDSRNTDLMSSELRQACCLSLCEWYDERQVYQER